VIAAKLIAGPSKCGRLLRIEYNQREHLSFEPIRAAAEAKGWKFITVRYPQVVIFGKKSGLAVVSETSAHGHPPQTGS